MTRLLHPDWSRGVQLIVIRQLSKCCARIIFERDCGLLARSTQNKQWRIELLYRYKRAITSRITVLNIRKLYLYFVYFKG